MKRIVCLLFLLLLCSAGYVLAEEAVFYTEVQPHLVRFSIDLPDCQFVYVKFDTQDDSGSMVLYDENGHFSGECLLPGTCSAARLGLNVSNLAGHELAQTRIMLPEDPDPAAPAAGLGEVQASGKVRDLTITAIEGGLHYRFTAAGRDTVTLRCKSPQEWHRIKLCAGAGYVYEGDIILPCTYADDTVTLTVLSGSGSLLAESAVLMPYHAPEEPDTLQSTVLRGVTVCIDPGHQRTSQVETVLAGPNFRTTKTTTIGMAKGRETQRMESQVVLEIGMQLRNALLAQGASVVMTRMEQDTFVGFLERSDIPNSIDTDFVLRLHGNSRSSSPDVQGIEVYCPLNSSYARQVASEEKYKQMGETLLAAIQEATGMHKGACTLNDNYVGNNWSKMPSFLVEMGYMTNMEEDLLLACPAYQQRLAEGMTQGIISLARLRGLIQ